MATATPTALRVRNPPLPVPYTNEREREGGHVSEAEKQMWYMVMHGVALVAALLVAASIPAHALALDYHRQRWLGARRLLRFT